MNSQCSGLFQCGPSSLCCCYPSTRLAAAHLQKNCEKLQTIGLVLAGAYPVQTEAEDFKSTVLSEDLVTLFTHMALPGLGVLGNVGLVSRLPWIQQGLCCRTVNTGSSRGRVLLLTFVCGRG
jgi:hypothetical protein